MMKSKRKPLNQIEAAREFLVEAGIVRAERIGDEKLMPYINRAIERAKLGAMEEDILRERNLYGGEAVKLVELAKRYNLTPSMIHYHERKSTEKVADELRRMLWIYLIKEEDVRRIKEEQKREGFRGNSEEEKRIEKYVTEIHRDYPIILKNMGLNPQKREVAFELTARDESELEKMAWEEIDWEERAKKYRVKAELDELRREYLKEYSFGRGLGNNLNEKATVLFVRPI